MLPLARADNYKLNMRKQRVLLGELRIEREAPIELFAALPCAEARQRAAALKDKLAFLLDTRFWPANPEPPEIPGLTVIEVATLLHCRCVTVLRMIQRGQLHPGENDDDLIFDPAEVARLKHVPISREVSRLIPRD